MSFIHLTDDWQWWGAFLTTAWSTCIVSFALIICEYILWYHGTSNEPEKVPPSGNEHHHPVQRAILVLERLINAFSEQQSVAGLSLIVVAGHDGCELSAYIYNLICFQLIMSLISHLNALTNTRNWFGEENQSLWRGIATGVIKILPIMLTIIMAGVMLGARIGGDFPSYAGVLATLPAVCFENTNALAGLDSLRDTIDKHKSDWANNGFVQYMILVFDLIVVGFIFAIALLKKIKHRPNGFRMRVSLILRSASTIATTGTLCWLSVQYILMRKKMESKREWYESTSASNQYSYYNVVTWALFASSLITVFKAFAGKSIINALSQNSIKTLGLTKSRSV
jgi:hypothetical protein